MPKALLVILVVGLALRLGWSLSREAGDEAIARSLPDQREYLELGRNLLHRHELVMHDPRFDADVRAFRMPGYPMLVAMCGGDVRAVRIVQALLDTSTVLAIFLLARFWLGERAGLLAAAVVAVNPFLIYFSSLILSETLFIALLAWGMFLLTQKQWWIGAAILAISVVVRPGAMALPICLATSINLKRAALTGLLTIIVLFPWAMRNHSVLGRWVWTSTNAGITLYDGFRPGATGASDQSFVNEMRDELSKRSELERSDYLANLAKESRVNPILALRKIVRTWSPIPLSNEYGGNVTLLAIAAGYTIPLFALVVIGLIKPALPTSAKIMLMIPAIYFTVTVAMSVGSLRYRVPADVPMAVIAASVFARRTSLASLPSPRARGEGEN